MSDAYIPYGGYWSTPYAKWQGSLSHLHSVKFAAHVARAELERRSWDAGMFDYGVLGMTVPQHQSFYGAPWLMGLVGAERVGGPTINQACATGARSLHVAAAELASEMARCALVITTDRCSNGPHLYYPNPAGPGGTGAHEDWVLDNFGCDPWASVSMLQTAENCARKWEVSTDEQHAVVLRRYEQYTDATKDGAAFLKRFMRLPFEVPDAKFRKTVATLDGDEGVFATSKDKLAGLKPVMKDGTVTFGGQTHPADGATAMVVTTRDRARELSADGGIEIRVAGFGQARTDKAFMPAATVPAAKAALARAGVGIDQMAAIKSHNPFAVNDVVFARETGVDVMAMNNYGSSLVWGHPQGPTGLRCIVELIEELALRGGGYGLFQGCAAGDCAMAVVLEVSSR